MTRSQIGRACVAAVAVVVLAWLGVMERDVRLQDRAAAASRLSDVTPAELAHAETDLRRARLLNPDTTPDVARSAVVRLQGRERDALALLQDIARTEPENLLAWRLLGLYARGSDPALERRALAAQRRLDPVGAARD